MRLSIIYLCVILFGCKKSNQSQEIPPYHYQGLIDKQINFSPSIIKTNNLLYFQQSYQKSVCLDFNIQELLPTISSPQAIQILPNGSSITPMNFNFSNWAQQVKSTGANLCFVTINTGYGFSLFDSKTPWPIPSQLWDTTGTTFASNFPSGKVLPQYTKYDVGQGANPNFFDQFCQAMRAQGIEPAVYIPVVTDINRLGGNIFDGQPQALINAFEYWFCCYVQEIILRYNIKYIWFDQLNYASANFMQKIYNAVKSVTGQGTSNECMVIGNAAPGSIGSGGTWPIDINAFEYAIWYGSSTPTIWETDKFINGTNYYIPIQMVDAVAQNEYYYQNCSGCSGYGTFANQSLSQLTTEWKDCQKYGAGFCIFIPVDWEGNIPISSISLIGSIY